MNIAAAVLTFREGLEAALVVAIMLSYLRKLGRMENQWLVWAGVISASTLAVAFTVVLAIIGETFDYPAKGIYRGGNFATRRAHVDLHDLLDVQAGAVYQGLARAEHEGQSRSGRNVGLFGVAFLTVAREGVETALFLSASAFGGAGAATVTGGVAGLLVAMAVAYAVYVAGIRLNMRTFFKVASVLLLIFGAAILRYAVQEFEEVGWLPPLVEHVWNTGNIVPSGSTLGSVLGALIGYKSNPSLMQMIAYVGYLLVVGIVLFRPAPKTSAEAPQTVNTTVTPVAETVPVAAKATSAVRAGN